MRLPQEGLTNNPGTENLLVEGLRRGTRVIGAAPYCDPDPRGQIDRIFALARDWDVDMHLDMGETPDGMQAEYVCRKTEEYGWGGRVTVGHATQMSLVPPAHYAALAATLARAGAAVTVLPSTDLFLQGRSHGHAVPRGVLPLERLRAAGVTCSVATNNVLNPFTPYGDANLLRMANLYANVCQVSRPGDLAACLGMVTTDAARLIPVRTSLDLVPTRLGLPLAAGASGSSGSKLVRAGMMRVDGYGIRVGAAADLVLLQAATGAGAVAELAQPLWGMKAGRLTFTRARPVRHRPAG